MLLVRLCKQKVVAGCRRCTWRFWSSGSSGLEVEDEIATILCNGRLSAKDKRVALGSLNLSLSKRLVAHVVKRLRKDACAAFLFIKWAASAQAQEGNGDAVGYQSYARVAVGLARACKFEEMWDLMDDMNTRCHYVIGADIFNAVIQCYGRAGNVAGALTTFSRMSQDFSCAPVLGTYQALVRVLVGAGQHETAVSLYWDMVNKAGLIPNLHICKAILGGLGLAGAVESAMSFLAGLDTLGVVSRHKSRLHNALVQGYVEAGQLEAAFGAMTAGIADGSADSVTYNLLALGCCRAGKLDVCVELYQEMRGKGFPVDHLLFNTLVCNLCKAGRTDEACLVLDEGRRSPGADVVTFSTVIHSLCSRGDCQRAGELVQAMEAQLVAPNVVTYTSIMDGLCKAGSLGAAFGVFHKMQAAGCSPNTLTYNCLIDGLCKAGRLEDAFALLRAMPSKGCCPSVNNKNTLMSGICRHIIAERQRRQFGKLGQRLFSETMAESCAAEEDTLALLYACLEHMFGSSGDRPDKCTYSIVIHFLCKADKVLEAGRVWQAMVTRIGQPDAVAYNSFLYGLVKVNNLGEAARLFQQIDEPTLVSYSLLIHAYFKAGDLSRAWEAYQAAIDQGMPLDLVLYNIMLDGLSKNKLDGEVAQLCAEMLNNGISPSVFTYTVLIHGLCRENRLHPARQILDKMKERGCLPDAVTYNTFLHCLCKNDLLDDALALLHEMKQHCSYTPATWNIIIDGMLELRDLGAAEAIFTQLNRDKCFPAYVTYDTFISRALHRNGNETSLPATDMKRLDTVLSFGYSRIVGFFL